MFLQLSPKLKFGAKHAGTYIEGLNADVTEDVENQEQDVRILQSDLPLTGSLKQKRDKSKIILA